MSFRMALYREQWPAGYTFQATTDYAVIWIETCVGNSSSENGFIEGGKFLVQPGETILNDSPESANVLRFNLSLTNEKTDFESIGSQIPRVELLNSQFKMSGTDNLIRCDQVDFPPSATAYRHIHFGAGIRYLTSGRVQLDSDHGTEHVAKGDAWFEDANSPVKATATDGEPSQFIRVMVVPAEFKGVSTFSLLNTEDAQKPRSQTTTRHFEYPLIFE